MRTIIDAHKHSLLQLKGPAVRTGLLKAPKLESLVVEPQLLFILPLLQEIKGHDRRARSCGVIHPISPNGSPMPLAGKAIAIKLFPNGYPWEPYYVRGRVACSVSTVRWAMLCPCCP